MYSDQSMPFWRSNLHDKKQNVYHFQRFLILDFKMLRIFRLEEMTKLYTEPNAIWEKDLFITSKLIQKDLYLWNILSY